MDPHLADQILPFLALLALVEGQSTIATSEITQYLATVEEVAGEITGAKIEIEDEIGSPGRVSVDGVGFRRSDEV